MEKIVLHYWLLIGVFFACMVGTDQVVTCPNPPSIIEGEIISHLEDYTYGRVVQYTCHKGFTLRGDQTISCGENGTWTPNPPKCQKIECPAPVIANAERTAGRPPYSYQSYVVFKCKHGFVLSHHEVLRCGMNNTWIPAPPTCRTESWDVPTENKTGVEGPDRRVGTKFNSREYEETLNVSNGGQLGDWTWLEMCPDKFFAVGFSLKVENKDAWDDTALNGVRLICAQDSDRSVFYTIESHTGYYGAWTPPQYCEKGMLTSFQLRVEPHQGEGVILDDTAANNIRFRCSSEEELEGTGLDWGEYGDWSDACEEGSGVCGIKTRMELYQGRAVDDTALNDLELYCCKKPQ